MPQFSYTAHNAQGEVTQGSLDALSIQAARDALKEMQLEPEEIHETTKSEEVRFSDALPPLSPLTPEHAEQLLSAVPPPSPLAIAEVAPPEKPPAPPYFPLIDTFRLYAGWLLAWYFLVYAVGSYQHFRPLPFHIPYLEGLFLSPLVLSFTLAAFLFLLLSNIWKVMGAGFVRGLLLMIFGVACFLLYRVNVL